MHTMKRENRISGNFPGGHELEKLSKLDIWILASRPKTLPAAITPVVIGTAFAIRLNEFSILPAIAALIGSLLLQVAANFANDYYDFKKGIDTKERIGPTRVLSSGLLSERELKIGLLVIIIISMIIGLYLI